MKITLIIVLIIFFILLCCVLGYFIFKLQDSDSHVKEENNNQNTKKQNTITDVVELVSDDSLTRKELFLLCEAFLKHNFPSKNGSGVPDSAKEYLNFILLIASHKNADAKIISFLNTEAKKKNPEYASDIERYESLGLQQRKKT
ncbi:hypothetical protein [Campylobacter pinnipediorum]|uniref:hypothetical protein n=1 Tax=Campylobacter pinnipediorum TaxID=1965231 RepID=UPI0009957519|nr:hypothetical protein [Campylobacter pinnipediorum]AQW82694.1 hypothetical protein CPIN17261_0681 [Campylobacter pinnipediorum subsp. pinnipediorum]AQW84381.1 hypothetical protein CPIN17262_0695 [Campylobacter pinnipediorum subsp. pinnipediorum]